MYVDGSGYLYVAEMNNHRIQKFPPNSTSATNGTTVAGGNGSGNAANRLARPSAVYVDGSGNIYVADTDNRRIQKFPPNSTSATNGTTVAGGNGYGTNANQLTTPTGIYVGGGNLYVADQANHRIQKFGPNSTSATSGSTVAGATNSSGNALNRLAQPTGVYVDGSGYLYVADMDNHRVLKFGPNPTSATSGTIVAGGNGSGSAANQLSFPRAVFVDGGGNVYVADQNNWRVQRFPPLVSAPTLSGLSASPNPICAGQSITFTATVGNTTGTYNYTLTNAAGTSQTISSSQDANFNQSLTASGSGLQTFTLTVATTAGSASGTVGVTVNALPTPAITGLASAYCQDAQAVTLTGTPAEGGVFTIDGQTATSFSPTSLSVGAHTVRYTVTTNGCSGFTEQSVEIKAVPTPAITGLASTYCKDAQAVILTGTPSEGGVFTVDGQTATSFTPASLSVGNHTVRYTVTTNGCSAYTEKSVEIKVLPTPEIRRLAAAYCQDAQPVSLTGVPTGGTFTIDGQTATQLDPASLSVGNHTVRYTVTNNSGCTGFAEQVVEIKAVPTPEITGLASAYCQDAQAITLTGTPSEGGVFTIDGETATLFSPTSLSVGNHTVRYRVTTNGCSATARQTVEIKDLPTPEIRRLAAAYCQDAQPVSLTGVPTGGTFTIDGQTATQLDPASLSVGNHTVRYTVTNNSGCTGFAEQLVEIKAMPTPAITDLASAYCKDAQAVTLTGTPTEGGVFTIDGETATLFSPVSLSVGNHTVRYRVTTNGCSATARQTVEIKALPTPTITAGLANAYCKDAQAVTLTGTPSEGGVFTIDGQTATSFTPASLSVGTHTVRYTVTTNGCSGFTEQSVEIKAVPTPAITGLASAYCKDAQGVTLTGTPTEGGVFTVDGQTATSFTPASLSVGTHTVRYTVTTNGCSGFTEQSVEIKPVLSPTLMNSGPLSFTNTPVTLTATGGTSYSFSTGANQQGNGPIATVTTPGIYSVTATLNGCSGTASTTVTGGNNPTVCRGGTAVISVAVSGDPVKYEWYKNSLTTPKIMETPQLFKGTATSSLTLINAQTNTQGNFYLKVTERSGTITIYGPYRLTVDGSCRARELAVETLAEAGLGLTLLGNPVVDGHLKAVVKGAAGQRLQLDLRDSQGRPVRSQQWAQAEGEQVVEWDLSQQPAGLYLLQAQTSRHSLQHKVVKP
ncbi:hypothetical protein GCM10027341_21570 [Spirosoma knui]